MKEGDDSSERSSTVADDREYAEMRMGDGPNAEKIEQRQVEQV